MYIKPSSWWTEDDTGLEVLVKCLTSGSFEETLVHYDVFYGSGERLRSDKCGYKEFLYSKSPKNLSTEDAYEEGFKKSKEFNKDGQNLNYRTGYNDGWHDCEASFELGNDFTDSIQEQAYEEGFVEGYNQHKYETHQNLSEKEKVLKAEAWDEGYDQAIDDLIEAGVIVDDEVEYPDEAYSEECYSEYEFGDVEDDEEEYCFTKELEKVLNGEFTSDNKSEDVERKHSHYFKDVRHLDYIDVYQVCKLFPVDDDSGAITHSIKKLLVAGGRGAGKDMIKDITEARDTLNRYLQIEGIEE